MSKRILVVEDHADNRQIIRDMLAGTDYEITEAENGEEALAAIATFLISQTFVRDATGWLASQPTMSDRVLAIIPLISACSLSSTL
jgi:two-component system, cell cycle response regulator DivK